MAYFDPTKAIRLNRTVNKLACKEPLFKIAKGYVMQVNRMAVSMLHHKHIENDNHIDLAIYLQEPYVFFKRIENPDEESVRFGCVKSDKQWFKASAKSIASEIFGKLDKDIKLFRVQKDEGSNMIYICLNNPIKGE